MKNWWDVLGIDPNSNKKEIRKAYSEAVKKFHPEEHPEEYKEIREAYETAIYNVQFAYISDIQKESLYDLQFEYESTEEVLDATTKTLIDNVLVEKYNEVNLYYKPFKHTKTNIDEVLDSTRKTIDVDNPEEEKKNAVYSLLKFIEDEKERLYNELFSLIEGADKNNVQKWSDLFSRFVGHEELLLEALFEQEDLMFENELVIFFFEEIIAALPREDTKIYKERVSILNDKHRDVRHTLKGYRVYDVMDVLNIVMVGVILFYFYILFTSVYQIISVHNEMLFYNALTFIISGSAIYQTFLILNRCFSKGEQFYGRDKCLVQALLYVYLIAICHIVIHFWLDDNIVLSLVVMLFCVVAMLLLQRVLKKIGLISLDETGVYESSVLQLSAGLMVVFVLVTGIMYMLKLKDTQNLLYLFILGYEILILCSVSNTAMLLVDSEKNAGIQVKNQQKMGWINLVGNIFALNLLCYYLTSEPMYPFSALEYALFAVGAIASLFVMFNSYRIHKERRIRFIKLFDLPKKECVKGVYRHIALKCKKGKNYKNINGFEKRVFYVYSVYQQLKKEGISSFLNDETSLQLSPIMMSSKDVGCKTFTNLLMCLDKIVSHAQLSEIMEDRKMQIEELMKEEEVIKLDSTLESLLLQSYEDIVDCLYQYMLLNKQSFTYKGVED